MRSVLLLALVAQSTHAHRQRQLQQPDFCQSDECACPWAGKEFTVPSAGGLGPFDDGAYLPYPRQYVAYRTDTPPVIDGDLSDPAWAEVAWTEDFADISVPQPGRGPAAPPLRTNAKMRWDDEFVYIGAFLEEPDVWANLTEQNSVIFEDPDFEVFVDPLGCNHQYKEFEMNALNTTWDLLLNRPYGDGGGEDSRRVDPEGWTMTLPPANPPLYCRAHVNGPINDPSTPNGGWSVEIALPIVSAQERQEDAGCGGTVAPTAGTQWRIDFSRVNWHVIVVDGRYMKDPERPHEDNWVWSPQGRVDMHQPEHWGYLQFADGAVNETAPLYDEEWPVRSIAMGIYWAQRLFAEQNEGLYTDSLTALAEFSPAGLIDGTCAVEPPSITLSEDREAWTATVVVDTLDGSARVEATITSLRLLTVSVIEGDGAARAEPPAKAKAVEKAQHYK
jgi:hypothetical protein